MYRTSKLLSEWLNRKRAEEEDALPSGAFTGRIASGYKYGLVAVSAVGIGMGYFLSVPVQDPEIGMIFAALGFATLMMLPTYFSYRCYVDKNILKAEYVILCFKIRKECLWKDAAYKIVKRDAKGDALSIRLYDVNKKKRISFDFAIVGFGKIVRMAKRIPSLKKKT